MAVKLTSDLIMDVMRNAEPSRRQAAEIRLEQLGRTQDTAFASALGTAQQTSAVTSHSVSHDGLKHGNHETARSGDAYRGFEQIVLRSLFETLLPSPDSGAFGEGPSSGVWRSMAADQLAQVYSKAGGIGIASMIAPGEDREAPKPEGQWPYFSVGRISTFSG